MKHCLLGTFRTRNRADRRIFEENTVRQMWQKMWELLCNALKIHPSYERVSKFLTLEQFLLHLGIFPAFQVLITGMFNTNNLNGGLYLLHSHLNHSCQPNAKAVDVRGRLAELNCIFPTYSPSRDKMDSNKIVVVQEEIHEGEEITISYINPDWPGAIRRQTLKRDYGFDCRCKRCQAELLDTEGQK